MDSTKVLVSTIRIRPGAHRFDGLRAFNILNPALRSVMRGGGKTWLEIGDDMAFGCVLGLPMCFSVCLWR